MIKPTSFGVIDLFIVKKYLPSLPSTSKICPWTIYEVGMNFKQPKFASRKRKRSSVNKNGFDIENHYMSFREIQSSIRRVDANTETGIGFLYLLDYLYLCSNPEDKYKNVIHRTKMFGCMEKLIYHDRLRELKILLPCSNSSGFVTEDCSFPIVDDKTNYKKNKFKLNL